MEPFTLENVSNASSGLFSDNTICSIKFFRIIKWIWVDNGCLQYPKFPTIRCTRMWKMRNFHFMTQFTPKRHILGTWVVFFRTRHCGSQTLRETVTMKIALLLMYLVAHKKLNCPSLVTTVANHFSTDLGKVFGGDVGKDQWILMRGKGRHEPKFAYAFVSFHSLNILLSTVLLDTQKHPCYVASISKPSWNQETKLQLDTFV